MNCLGRGWDLGWLFFLSFLIIFFNSVFFLFFVCLSPSICLFCYRFLFFSLFPDLLFFCCCCCVFLLHLRILLSISFLSICFVFPCFIFFVYVFSFFCLFSYPSFIFFVSFFLDLSNIFRMCSSIPYLIIKKVFCFEQFSLSIYLPISFYFNFHFFFFIFQSTYLYFLAFLFRIIFI